MGPVIGTEEGSGMSDFFGLKVYSFAGNGDSSVSDGGCTQDHQTRTQCHVPAYVIFLAQ